MTSYYRVMLGKGSAFASECFAGGFIGVDFEIKEKEHTCALNDRGVKKAEALVGVGSFYIAGNMHWPHKIEQALRAHFLYRRDKEYVVQGDEVIIYVSGVSDLALERQALASKADLLEDTYGLSVRLEEAAEPSASARRAEAIQ